MAQPLRKILINNTASTIQILNRDVAAGASYEIPAGLWHKLYDAADLHALILSGDVIVNDGTQNLSASAGEQHIFKWQPNDQEYSPGKRIHHIQFLKDGGDSSKWMAMDKHVAGDQVLWVPSVNLKLNKITFTNKKEGSSAKEVLVKIDVHYMGIDDQGKITTAHALLFSISPTSSNTERWGNYGQRWIYDISSSNYQFTTTNAYGVLVSKVSGAEKNEDSVITFYCEEA